MEKLKQPIFLKILSLLGYIIFFYTLFWDFCYPISTEEELITKELHAILFGICFYVICFVILLFTIAEFHIKGLPPKIKLNNFFKIGLCLHITPFLNIFIIILLPFFKLLIKA